MEVQYFKAQKDTKRFKKGQKVWIRYRDANCLQVWSKWRGSGRYTQSTITRWDWSNKNIECNEVIGEQGLSSMEVDEEFGKRILGGFII